MRAIFAGVFERARQQVVVSRARRDPHRAGGNVTEKLFQRKKNVIAGGVRIHCAVAFQQRPLKGKTRIAVRERMLLAEVEGRKANLQETSLHFSGTIQVLEEELNRGEGAEGVAQRAESVEQEA